jgi:hypothetical protein
MVVCVMGMYYCRFFAGDEEEVEQLSDWLRGASQRSASQERVRFGVRTIGISQMGRGRIGIGRF